jgi:hypothetical protein
MAGKARINFFVDALMLLVGSLLAGTGFLMKYTLLPGFVRAEMYGKNVDMFFLGFDRHEWGALHLWLAFVLIALLVLHLVLHISWIINMARTMIAGRTAQTIIISAFVLLCLVFMFFAFAVQPEVTDSLDGGHGMGRGMGRGRMEHRLY